MTPTTTTIPACARLRVQLSAYLDGDLDAERGSVVRGHLRECAACRAVSTDEAALRDGLRALEAVDPPASLWAGIQARLAADDVAKAKQPGWRRALARWQAALARNTRPLLVGSAFAAAAIAFVAWRAHRTDEPREHEVVATTVPAIARPTPPPAPVVIVEDITADLAHESARIANEYAVAAAEELARADVARVQWSADKQAGFDARVAALRDAIRIAPDARTAQRTWRTLIRFAQSSVARDELAVADLATGGLP